MQIGLAGLGAMGANIAARLLDTGHQLTVWNRNAEKTKPLVAAGAKLATSPAALADASDIVLTILTDGAAIDAVYNGPNGLLFGDVKGKLLIEMSTVAPKIETDLAEKVRAKGAAFVECPVGGSTGPARQGKLLGLMGGEPADAERARPVLEQLCRKVEHCGPVGAGSAMKLAINLPLMVAWQAYGEAFALARQAGLDSKRIMDIFVESSGANNGLKTRADMIVAMLDGRDPGPTTFTIDNARKDLRTMIDAGTAAGADMITAKAALAGFDDASANGQGDGDGARLSVYWSGRKKK
ncbi:MAG: NAD(P)-dependent oxidoreductase [Pseudolabrys sp.]|nr:NAD(P)-dependent oxidoreductase [Pseudolabrys sp.]